MNRHTYSCKKNTAHLSDVLVAHDPGGDRSKKMRRSFYPLQVDRRPTKETLEEETWSRMWKKPLCPVSNGKSFHDGVPVRYLDRPCSNQRGLLKALTSGGSLFGENLFEILSISD